MALGDYKVPSHEFNLKGGSFIVKGLSLEDVTSLVQHHLPDLEALYDLFTKSADVMSEDFRPLVVSLVTQAPGFAANVIALAAGEPDKAKAAATLPFPVQVDVLLKVGDLTFLEVGGVKKALESIVPLLAVSKAKVTQMMSPTAA